MALRIGWFSTGRGPGSRQLLNTTVEAIDRGDIDVEIAFVFCSRDDGEASETDTFLELIRARDLPLRCFSSRAFEPELHKRGMNGDAASLAAWRTQYDCEVLKLIEPFDVPLSLLAGYMLISSDKMCATHSMINLHPAVPDGPRGTWQNVIWELIESRAESAGAMIHHVTPELDAGPPVAFFRFPLNGPSFQPLWHDFNNRLTKSMSISEIRGEEKESNQLFAEIRRRGLEKETPLILLTLQKLADGEIKLLESGVLTRNQSPTHGLDLSQDIDRYLEQGANRC